MNSIEELVKSIEIEFNAGQTKDFGLPTDHPYPLKSVTFPVAYGELPGYVAEDADNLDFLLGDVSEGHSGYIIVDRGEYGKEHKMFVNVSQEQITQIEEAYQPVLIATEVFEQSEQILRYIERFKANSA